MHQNYGFLFKKRALLVKIGHMIYLYLATSKWQSA